MAEENEEELLGADYIRARSDLSRQTTQMGGGFYQVDRETNYEESYPNAINDFVQTDSVKTIASSAGVTSEDLKPPFAISDDAITRINDIIETTDPLNLSDADLQQVRDSVDAVLSEVTPPTFEEITSFINNYTKFVNAAALENFPFPTNFREIKLVSTDTSIDSFIDRTGIRKLVAIRINKLAYPFITERFQIPSEQQATLNNTVGSAGDDTITFGTITKNVGVTEISPGSRILITNDAKKLEDLQQQKVLIDWISEETNTIRLKTPLLFDLDSTHLIQIYQYTPNQVLSPGDVIKIPK
ncbi:hypothetical protein KAR91_00695 [Candidatus Pacearchaeota archaeon]|nr:hypothetical protein [Candidatus Pacearchaeota archaeon]